MLYRSSMKWDIRRLNINPMADVNSAAVPGILCPDVRLLFPISLGQPFIQRSDLTKHN